jgi:GT2 family glycosyltransferase
LEAQAYSRRDLEVIVVDDGSRRRLDDIVRPTQQSIGAVLFRIEHAGPAAARNAGAGIARGRFLAFTDDDCWAEPNWISELEARLRRVPDSMVGGAVINRVLHNPYALASQIILDIVYAHYNSDPDDSAFFASNNMAMPAELFRQIGGFDASFPRAAAEDRDLCDRWRHAGHGMTYAPRAVIYHHHELTLKRFCRQCFNYGCGAWQYHQRRAQRGSGRLRDDLTFHARLPMLLPRALANLGRRQKIVVGGLMSVWQLANAAGFIYQALRHPWPRKPAPDAVANRAADPARPRMP